eukprot:TRINITY_DN658_c0_g1_i1.p1 TRINITY_DN658_c0_g1~~TRINITY_DN658_c0_g1_i1.p1  ORF type:complete len:141 (+),score=23.79 TRINITY_DN658_c0_g1_i1:61-483(+)
MNVKEISSEFFVSNQLSEEEIYQITSERGIQSIMNLRGSSEEGFMDESSLCISKGLTYVHSPVPLPPSYSAITSAASQLQAIPKPVLVHCWKGNRAAVAVFIHLTSNVTSGEVRRKEVLKLAETHNVDLPPALKSVVDSL